MTCRGCEIIALYGLTDLNRRLNDRVEASDIRDDERPGISAACDMAIHRAGEAIDQFNECCERIEAMG